MAMLYNADRLDREKCRREDTDLPIYRIADKVSLEII